MEFITDLLIKITPVILAAFLASRWAVSKFYAEKIWERREIAYENIIHSLYDLIHYFRVHKDDYGQGTGLLEEMESEVFQKYISAATSLGKVADIGSFYISDDANKVLCNLRAREQLNYFEEPKFEFMECEYQAHKKALDELMKIAKKDLRINRR